MRELVVPTTNDPPTAAQMSVLIERMNNLTNDVREMRKSQDRVEHVVLTIAGLQKDVGHLDEKVQHLFTMADLRGTALANVDKRVTALERWHKLMGTGVLAAAGMIGWGIQRIEHLYQMETRVQILELLVNSQNVGRAVQPPAAVGSK